MIVLRLLLVAVLIAVAALGLAWLVSGDPKYLGHIGRVLRFSIVLGFVAAVFYTVERLILR
ncbi:MAG: hypothetical protein ACYC5S_00395 [Thiobacillus sp.]